MKRALKALSRSEVARRLAQVSMDAQHGDLWLDEVCQAKDKDGLYPYDTAESLRVLGAQFHTLAPCLGAEGLMPDPTSSFLNPDALSPFPDDPPFTPIFPTHRCLCWSG